MADDKRGWKNLKKVNFDSKKLSKRMKKAEGATMRHAHKFIVGRLNNMRDVRRHIIGWLLLVGVMIAMVGLQLMWFQQSYQTTVAAEGGTYAEASMGPIQTLNPLYAVTSAEISASRLLFSSLYSYDETGNLRGDLATSTSIDETGTVYTVKIRSDAEWHDGRNVTANDVAFTINLIKNPAARSPLRGNWQDVRVSAIDDTTIQFRLPAAYAAFSHALTFSILPSHILGNVDASTVRENVFSRSPVGSGPFSFRLFKTVDTRDHKVVHMTASDNYYRGKPMINRFEVHGFETSEAILKALKNGQVNAAADLSSTETMQIDQRDYNTTIRPINSGVYALLNVDSPILKEKNVRRALQLATDTAKIRDNLTVKMPALDLPFVKDQLAGSNLPSPPESNDKKAAELLDSAGWKLDNGIRKNTAGQALTLTIATTKSAHYEKALELLAGQWRQLGIAVEMNVVDTNNPSSNFVQNILQQRAYDVLLYELSIGADPDVYAYWHSSQAASNGYNFSNYKNDTADAALASARSRLEPELRDVKYKAFAQQWVEDVPAIGLYQTVSEYVSSKQVQSVNETSKLISPYDRYVNVLHWSVNRESVYKTP